VGHKKRNKTTGDDQNKPGINYPDSGIPGNLKAGVIAYLGGLGFDI
jgi:hypothetical protein